MTLAEGEITELIGTIMSTAVDLEVRALAPGATDARVQPVVEGAIQISGTWEGVVVVHASQVLASICAQRMFDLGATEPTTEEVVDAFGELVNMAGGNIKALMSESGGRLSLPVVVRGDRYSVRVPGAHQMGRFEYACEGEPLVITVLERPAEGPPN